MTKTTPLCLIILDGWGLKTDPYGNAIISANPSFYESLLATYPWVGLEASGLAVGLPEGIMGNSEVGHTHMGAGRVVYQQMTRISKAIHDGDFFSNPVLLDAMAHAKKHNSTLHLMGLVSPGGVHSSMEHMFALMDMAKEQQVESLRFHAFLDGRDTPPKSAETYLMETERLLDELEYDQISTVIGRYYAMDRDNRWERVKKAYDNLVLANGTRHLFSVDALEMAYRQDENDEFVSPRVTDCTYTGMNDNDAVIFFNFRPDRARQLTRALTDPNFQEFTREKVLQNLHFTCMCSYDASFNLPVAYPKDPVNHTLGKVISDAGLKQYRTAETEKYAHVTYFLNCGQETPYPGEDRKLIDSPKVATYDLQPEMSLPAVTQSVLDGLAAEEPYSFIAVNFANPDMLGHTGMMPAATEAVEHVDKALKAVITDALTRGYTVCLTADHGNVETMIAENGEPHTAHTTNKVPFVLISNQAELLSTLNTQNTEGSLANIAPTILNLMGLSVPADMTSPSLLTSAPVTA